MSNPKWSPAEIERLTRLLVIRPCDICHEHYEMSSSRFAYGLAGGLCTGCGKKMEARRDDKALAFMKRHPGEEFDVGIDGAGNSFIRVKPREKTDVEAPTNAPPEAQLIKDTNEAADEAADKRHAEPRWPVACYVVLVKRHGSWGISACSMSLKTVTETRDRAIRRGQKVQVGTYLREAVDRFEPEEDD